MSGKTRKGSTVENYIQEELLALVPDYRDGECNTIVFTHLGEHRDQRSVNWLVKRLAAHFSLDLFELRRRCSKLLGLRHNISLPLDANLVLLPVKMRQADVLGEVTIGFVNLLQVSDILPPPQKAKTGDTSTSLSKGSNTAYAPEVAIDSSPVSFSGEYCLSLILFKNGLQLPALNTPETLRERLRQGDRVRREFLQRRIVAGSIPGLSREELFNILPPCECVLKDLFVNIFRKGV